MPDTRTLRPLDAALAALDSASCDQDLHRALASAAVATTGSGFAVVLTAERGELHVVARVGSAEVRRLPPVVASPAADSALQTCQPTTAIRPDGLALLMRSPVVVRPVTAAGKALALLVVDASAQVVSADLLLMLLCRYAGARLAHLSDTEVREDLLRQRGVTITALRRVADTDTLTGLANRAGLFSVLNSLMTRGHPVGVIYIDLDGFKMVNDEFGHDRGDEVLRAVADRLREAVRPTDLVGRLGGDEFLVVVRDTEMSGMARVVSRIDEVMEQPVTVGRRRVTIGASCGIALAEGGTTAQQLVAAADRAMYLRKRGVPARPPSAVIDLDSRR